MQLTGQVQTEESLETLICLYGLAMVLSGLQHQWFAVESGSVTFLGKDTFCSWKIFLLINVHKPHPVTFGYM